MAGMSFCASKSQQKSNALKILKVKVWGKKKKTYFKELLNDVISKHIHHKLVRSLQDFVEDKLALSCCGSL